MSVNIRPIRIIFDTNIPGKTPIPFTKSLLYNPELKIMNDFDEYPYFTMDIVFPFGYLKTLPYEKRLEFFFNKSVMLKTLKIKYPDVFKQVNITTEKPDLLTIDEVKETKQKENEEKERKNKFLDATERIKKMETEKANINTSNKNENLKIEREKWTAFVKKYETEAENTDFSNGNIKYMIKSTQEQKDLTIDDFVIERIEKIKKDNEEIKTILGKVKNDLNEYIVKLKGKTQVSNYTIKIINYNIDKSPYTAKEIQGKIDEICNVKIESFKNSQNKGTIDSITKVLDDIKKSYNINNIKEKKFQNFESKVNKEISNDGFFTTMPIELDALNEKYATDITEDKKKTKTSIETIIANKTKNKDAKINEIEEKIKKENEIGKNNEPQTVASRKAEIEKELINKKNIMNKKSRNSDENVLIMLQILFPTKYPIVGNVFSSFNSIILNKKNFTFSTSDFLPSFLKKKLIEGTTEYSYVKIDGQIYTITQAIWLNDIYNHTDYAGLITKFRNLKVWKEKALETLNDEIRNQHEKFNSNYENAFDSTDIEYIRQQKKYETELRKNVARSSYAIDKLQVEYFTFNKSVDDFINTIEKFQNSVKNKEQDSNISDNAKDMVESYKIVTKYGSNFFKTKEKYTNNINNVTRELEKIRINEYIRDTYISKPGIDLDYERDDKKYTSKLKSSFKEYTDFTDNIKEFRAPKKQSSNIYLQDTFNEFLEGREKYKGIFNYLMNPYNIHLNPFESIQKVQISEEDKESFKDAKEKYSYRKNTGVTIFPSAGANEPGYEIYVQLNVIEGELNNENKSQIDCLYKDKSLGSKYEYLLNETLRNPWDINSDRSFLKIKKKTDINEKNEKNGNNEKNEKIENNFQDKEIGEMKGGQMIQYNTRKLRADLLKTRKIYAHHK
jgi:hypothetical protein